MMRLSHLRVFGIVLLAVGTSLAFTTTRSLSEEVTTNSPSQDAESSTDVIVPKLKSDLPQANQDRFRQALSQEQQQNCLAQLLCGVRPAAPPSKKTNYVNDLAYVVKDFFDLIDVGESGADDEEDEEKANTKSSIEKAKSPNYKPGVSNIKKKQPVNDAMDDEAEDDPIRNSDEDKEVHFKYDSIKKITLEELVDDIKIRPEDLVKYNARNGRMLSERASQDLRRKMRQIQLETDDKKKLSIAADIANKLRTPRQCRQLSLDSNTVSSSSCPLTREVIKYLQTNIVNGSEKNKNETALASLNYAAQQGFLLVEGDKGETHVVDHNPIVANTFVATDLKNPSVPNRFATGKPVSSSSEEDEKTKSQEKEDGSKDKEEETEDEDDDTEGEGEGDENSSGAAEEYEEEEGEEDEEGEEEDEQEEERKRKSSQEVEEKNRKQKIQQRPLPPPRHHEETIKVYGIPTTSFGSDFNRVAATIGSSVKIFDQDDYDSLHMSGFLIDKMQSRHDVANKHVEKKNMKPTHAARTSPQSHASRNSHSHHRKRKPAPASDSVEDEEESNGEESQQIIIKASAQKPPAFVPPYVYGGNRPQEHFNNHQGNRPQEHFNNHQGNRPQEHFNNHQGNHHMYDPRPLPMRRDVPRPAEYRRTGLVRPARFYPTFFPQNTHNNFPMY